MRRLSGSRCLKLCLCEGGVLEILASEFNLLHLSNATALWMGINPPDIFLYVFLPPLLLDSAIRIDFFTFRKASPANLQHLAWPAEWFRPATVAAHPAAL